MAELISIEGHVLSFRKDGYWYADEDRIRHAKLQLLFSRNIRRSDDGGWMIDLGVDRQPAVVEDTPLVVRSADGSPDEGYRVTANDGEAGELNCETLKVGADNVLYCDLDRGDRGVLPARFLRPAYYQLLVHLLEKPDGLVLPCRGHDYRLGAPEGL